MIPWSICVGAPFISKLFKEISTCVLILVRGGFHYVIKFLYDTGQVKIKQGP